MHSAPEPGVSIRSDFVKRARYLKDDAEFRRALDETTRVWNAAFPDFRVRDDRMLPPDVLLYEPDAFLFPPKIEPLRHLDSAPAGQLYTEAKEAHLQIVQTQGTILQLTRAKQEWRQIVLGRCERFWPEQHYPNWRERAQHPAHHFVAASIIWRPQYVPEEWILRAGIMVHSIPLDPGDPESINHLPPVVHGYTFKTAIYELVNAEFQTAATIDHTVWLRIVTEAEDQAEREMQKAEQQSRPTKVVAIHRGLTASDLKLNAQTIRSAANEGDSPRDRARNMYILSGMGVAKIATILGRSEKMIRNYLSDLLGDR